VLAQYTWHPTVKMRNHGLNGGGEPLEARYPNSDEAATALYKHARYLCMLRDFSRGQDVLSREIRQYPKGTATDLARELLKQCR